MHRRITNRLPFAGITLALAAAATLTGCASSSRTSLGIAQPQNNRLSMGVGDTLGASMFSEHVRLAAAEARHQRALNREYATVNVPVE